MRLVAFTIVLLTSTSATLGDELLVQKVSAAVEKARLCGYTVDETRLAEAVSTGNTPLATEVTTIDELNSEIIEPLPPSPQEPSAAARPSDEPDGPELQSLGCPRLLEEFGPGGTIFAGLVRDDESVAPADAGEPLVPSRRVKTVKVRPDGTVVDE